MNDAPDVKQNANGIYMLEGEQLWDSDILPVCLEHIKEGDTVIDAGAWIGGHTMEYAKKVGEAGWVLAFEPNPYAYDCLCLNTAQFRNVCPYRFALGDESVLKPFSAKKGWYDSGHVGWASEKWIPDAGTIAEVKMKPLDTFELAPNFIKIDVEGCELKVLKGAERTIEKHHPIMVIEINEPALKRQESTPQQVIDWLSASGYGMSMIEECNGQDIYNILCLPR